MRTTIREGATTERHRLKISLVRSDPRSSPTLLCADVHVHSTHLWGADENGEKQKWENLKGKFSKLE